MSYTAREGKVETGSEFQGRLFLYNKFEASLRSVRPNLKKIKREGTGDIVQHLRALVIPVENLGFVFSTYIAEEIQYLLVHMKCTECTDIYASKTVI